MDDRAPGTSRREFARALAAAAAGPALLPAVALGQTAATAPGPMPAATPVPTPEAPSSTAEALAEIVRIRWGKNLSGEQLADISKAIDGRLRGADAMKRVKLTNADEPDVVFFADAEGGR